MFRKLENSYVDMGSSYMTLKNKTVKSVMYLIVNEEHQVAYIKLPTEMCYPVITVSGKVAG